MATDDPASYRCDAAPDRDGIARVRHGLGTTEVTVTCQDPQGRPVGTLGAVVISPDEVEVALAPTAQVAAIIVTATT